MIITKCDRCGEVIVSCHNTPFWYEFFKRYRIRWKGSGNEIHLCRNCEKDFEAFLKEKKDGER